MARKKLPHEMTPEQLAEHLAAEGLEPALIAEMLRARETLLRMAQAEREAASETDEVLATETWVPEIPPPSQEQLDFLAALGDGALCLHGFRFGAG